MGVRDQRVDAYIAKSADFAQPILRHIRETVHLACPEVEEDLKWSTPHFMYHGMMCGMAAFKEHCAFGFWKGSLIAPAGEGVDDAMGQFGRIAAVGQLPSRRVLVGYVKKAMKLNEKGVKVPRSKAKPKAVLVVPPDLKRALQRNQRARATFEAFIPSKRREYVEWVIEAKGAETRARRLATAVEWMAEGKARNWKYLR
ncbi:MAG TPA: YdeI/OmpD-associated family protein [Gemmatimonadales bacterium]